MARIRTIKPEFWTNEQVVNCSRDARLLFIGLWSFADDGGVQPMAPKAIKMRVFPGDDDISSETIRRLVDELSRNGLTLIYSVGGIEYVQVTGWKAHQRIEKPSFKYPQPGQVADKSAIIPGTVVEPSATAGVRSLREGNGEEGNGNRVSSTTTVLVTEGGEVEDVKVEDVKAIEQPLENKSQEAPAPKRDQEKKQTPDFTKVNPKDWPRSEIERVARELAPLIWSTFDAQAQYETYRVSGAVGDITIMGRWLAHGFTPDDIKGALAHAAITTTATVSSPLAYVGKVIPQLLGRKRETGSYEEPRPGAKPAVPGAGIVPRPVPGEPVDSTDYLIRRREGEVDIALRELPRWIKRGKTRWPSLNAGPMPGHGGSHITQQMLRDCEIELGVRSE